MRIISVVYIPEKKYLKEECFISYQLLHSLILSVILQGHPKTLLESKPEKGVKPCVVGPDIT